MVVWNVEAHQRTFILSFLGVTGSLCSFFGKCPPNSQVWITMLVCQSFDHQWRSMENLVTLAPNTNNRRILFPETTLPFSLQQKGFLLPCFLLHKVLKNGYAQAFRFDESNTFHFGHFTWTWHVCPWEWVAVTNKVTDREGWRRAILRPIAAAPSGQLSTVLSRWPLEKVRGSPWEDTLEAQGSTEHSARNFAIVREWLIISGDSHWSSVCLCISWNLLRTLKYRKLANIQSLQLWILL